MLSRQAWLFAEMRRNGRDVAFGCFAASAELTDGSIDSAEAWTKFATGITFHNILEVLEVLEALEVLDNPDYPDYPEYPERP